MVVHEKPPVPVRPEKYSDPLIDLVLEKPLPVDICHAAKETFVSAVRRDLSIKNDRVGHDGYGRKLGLSLIFMHRQNLTEKGGG